MTHEEDVAGAAQRIVRLRDGLVVSDHPTEEDPIHREFLAASAEAAKAAASKVTDEKAQPEPAKEEVVT